MYLMCFDLKQILISMNIPVTFGYKLYNEVALEYVSDVMSILF